MAAYLTAAILFFSVLASSASAEETLASPIRQFSPQYPEKCINLVEASNESQTVSVTYDLTREGLPENVRVRESTNSCFNEVAVAAVRSWSFNPRRVDAKPQPQKDLETTFRFELDLETTIDTFDARPLKRIPPAFPDKCGRLSPGEYVVVVKFDVNASGKTENIEVIETTHSCFDKAAIKSIEKWTYLPRIVEGQPIARSGVATKIIFVLSSSNDPKDEIRKRLLRKLNKAGRYIKSDPERALAELAVIEAEYGDSFTQAESAAFHQIRGYARIGVNDAYGALDDLRIARLRAKTAEETEAIDETIAQLELYVMQLESQERSE